MNNIYLLWWQGINNAPDIIKFCYKSLLRNYNKKNQKVILIDETNYKEYVELPNFIIEKFEKKQISVTHLSDIIRFKLLYDNGGLWVDASMFFTTKLDNSIFEKEFFVMKNPSALNNDITSKWECFFIGGKKNFVLFKLLYEFWIDYWSKNDDLITYLLTEHIFYIAYTQNTKIKQLFDQADTFTYPIDYLQKIMNKPYKKDKLEIILKSEKYIKLSYKKELKREVNNRLTNYGKLLEIYNEEN